MNNFKLKTIVELPLCVKNKVSVKPVYSTQTNLGQFELNDKNKIALYEKTEDKKKVYVITTNPLFDEQIFRFSTYLAREIKYLCSFDIVTENVRRLTVELEPDKIYDISFTYKEKHFSFIIKEKYL